MAAPELGAKIKALRNRRGLTQEQLAERCGVHATEVSRIEAGRRDMHVSTLERIAAALDVRPGDLLD